MSWHCSSLTQSKYDKVWGQIWKYFEKYISIKAKFLILSTVSPTATRESGVKKKNHVTEASSF